MRKVAFGDSMTANSQGHMLMWLYLLCADQGVDPLNLAIGGQGVADQTDAIFNHVHEDGDLYFAFLGNVDASSRINTDGTPWTGAVDLFRQIYLANLSWIKTNKTLVNNPAWTFTGTWSQPSSWPWTIFWPRTTWTNGDYAEITAPSTGLFDLAFLMVDGHDTTFEVYVNSVLQSTRSVTPPCDIRFVPAGRNYAPAVIPVTANSGDVIKIVRISGSANSALFLLWLGYSLNENSVFVFTLPNHNNPVIQARADAYNEVISSLGGVGTTIIHAGETIVPYYDLQVDETHLGAAGQAKYMIAARKAGA